MLPAQAQCLQHAYLRSCPADQLGASILDGRDALKWINCAGLVGITGLLKRERCPAKRERSDPILQRQMPLRGEQLGWVRS